MNAMAPIRTAGMQGYRVRLAAGPAAAAQARAQVRAAVAGWELPVDPDVAVLLASELVTNAARNEPGDSVALVITCWRGQLRVDVHDCAPAPPVLVDAPAGAEAGRGLMLVASLAAGWGWYRTAAGKAVWFALAPLARQGAGRGLRGL